MSESYGKEKNSWFSGLRKNFGSLKDQSFLKPFSILLVLQAIGFEWVGLPFIAYYMVGILIEADIPFDSYFVSAGISLSRLLSFVVFTFFVANRVKRRPLFISTAVVVIIGNLSRATYFIFKND